MAINVFLIVCLSMTFCSATNNPPSYCLPIQPIAQDLHVQPQPEVMTQQGRPGKTGPIGPVGPMGPQGVPGTPGGCACKPSEIEQLKTEIRKIGGK